MNAELNYHLYRDVKDYLEKINKWDRYSATPNNNHIILLHLRKRYGEDVVQVEINKQTQENKR
jgi:hypothetical protein